MTLKSGSEVTHGHSSRYHSKLGCGFLFAFQVTMAPSSIISETKRDTSWKSWFFIPPWIQCPHSGRPRRNIAILFGVKQLEWRGYLMVKMFKDMYNCLDRILTCDRQTDTQTSFHGIVRAMHMHHVVKTDPRPRARSGWTPQFNQFSTVIHCLCLPCLVNIRKFVCDRQTDRQTARITLLCLCRVITQMQTDMDKSHKTKKNLYSW